MDAGARTYEVTYDDQTTERFDKAAVRFFWREWFYAALNELSRFLIVAFMALLFYDMFRNVDAKLPELLTSGFIASGIGAGWYIVVALSDLRGWRSADLGEIWHCSISDAAWSYQRRDGTLVSHPWSTMKMRFEHADGFLVGTTNGDVLVYRRPMQDAGLEDEFLSRLRADD